MRKKTESCVQYISKVLHAVRATFIMARFSIVSSIGLYKTLHFHSVYTDQPVQK